MTQKSLSERTEQNETENPLRRVHRHGEGQDICAIDHELLFDQHEALRYAANILRTLSVTENGVGLAEHLRYAARRLDAVIVNGLD